MTGVLGKEDVNMQVFLLQALWLLGAFVMDAHFWKRKWLVASTGLETDVLEEGSASW